MMHLLQQHKRLTEGEILPPGSLISEWRSTIVSPLRVSLAGPTNLLAKRLLLRKLGVALYCAVRGNNY